MPDSLVDILCLGFGWTGQFLLQRFDNAHVSYAFTATSHEHGLFNLGAAGWQDSVHDLPMARMVVVIFPIKDICLLEELVQTYETAHGETNWLLLGSTGIWKDGYHTSSSQFDPSNVRGQVESRLLQIRGLRAAVLNLSGLYGIQRQPKNFILKGAPTRDALEQKSSLHLVHGDDVASAILSMFIALSDDQARARLWAKRWIVSDSHVYDWWHLAGVVPDLPEQYSQWSRELATKYNVNLPRSYDAQGASDIQRSLKRVLNGREFWDAAQVGISSLHGRFYEGS
ncbi:hypothetical protein K437DRAFT_225037 [Tilletiaria anomala UBC 951]|uniref:NAD(P)-binding protein n=1 Tax=Tilletiaria anomala (strain ATCC 24038 / CBS 436.72 / UBC 951) TaxID=1037660 RepID=A0A066VRA2_TILAU|nr:uncharacterized protein K437DRAFT_225037 [Tilletiaria anomala UBC 951]KDN44272.1 hypothetical protein K437DRAFT_225037 [Tilletiaria anomala UBC 951]